MPEKQQNQISLITSDDAIAAVLPPSVSQINNLNLNQNASNNEVSVKVAVRVRFLKLFVKKFILLFCLKTLKEYQLYRLGEAAK
jgi:hypothetical protein